MPVHVFFPLSDASDFADLVRAVKDTGLPQPSDAPFSYEALMFFINFAA